MKTMFGTSEKMIAAALRGPVDHLCLNMFCGPR